MVVEMSKVYKKLSMVMADIFQIDIADISYKSSPHNIQNWDSLKHMLLLMALEEEYEFRFGDDELALCLDVQSIMQVLNNKI